MRRPAPVDGYPLARASIACWPPHGRRLVAGATHVLTHAADLLVYRTVKAIALTLMGADRVRQGGLRALWPDETQSNTYRAN